MNGVIPLQSDHSEFVEVDPTGRYGRYDEILGKGSSKTVYRAFDEYEGIEVAWNQVRLYDFLRSPEDLERLYCEIHLLKTLKHRNIMKFYTSWVDTANRNINFVTELFTSGTLRQYRLKHKRVSIRAVKRWCKQILSGLLYLHSHDPPVIHRDLKCDNIFINGNQGEVKIGDLGLAAILRKSHAARCVGTPEFMAPEVYEEEYNELVDIYSFGMCILEMVTFEYPYSECNHPAQIYKKVISGKKPEALYRVQDPEVRQFVEKCLTTASQRLSARELIKDPFLQAEDDVYDLNLIEYLQDFGDLGPMLRQPLLQMDHSNRSSINGYPTNYLAYEPWNEMDYNPLEYEENGISLFKNHENEHLENVDVSIKGRRREDDGIFLRLRIADKEGRIRNIYFPFDIENDTALSVASEMVAELDIMDQDVMKIADMIDGEIASLVPGWNPRTTDALMDYVSLNTPGAETLQVLQCPEGGVASLHGRFEEITYQYEESEQCVTDGAPAASSQSDGAHYSDIWAQRDGPEFTSRGSCVEPSHGDNKPSSGSTSGKDDRIIDMDNESQTEARNAALCGRASSSGHDMAGDFENEIRQEIRWLKAKYQMQLRELKDQKLKALSKSAASLDSDNEQKKDQWPSTSWTEENERHLTSGNGCSSCFSLSGEKECAHDRGVENYEAVYNSCNTAYITAKTFYTGALLPQSLHRATSLPVDAVDF